MGNWHRAPKYRLRNDLQCWRKTFGDGYRSWFNIDRVNGQTLPLHDIDMNDVCEVNQVSGTTMSRRYTDADLRGLTKKQLIAIIDSQPHHIPNPFNRSKIMKAALVELLLSPTSPFRTSDPPLDDIEPEETSLNLNRHVSKPPSHSNSQRVTEPPEPSMTKEADQSRLSRSSLRPATRSPDASSDPSVGDCGNIDLRLYIEDARYVGQIREKTSAMISIEGLLISPNAVQVRTHDIVHELQAGLAAITGTDSVRLGLQDMNAPDFTEYFVDSHPSELDTAPTKPETILITVESDTQPYLKLRVDHSCVAPPIGMNASVDEASVSVGHIGPSPNDRTQLVLWLRSKAVEQTGYQVFLTSKHHLRQNTDISQSWRFAAEFSRRHYKQVHPFQSIAGKILKSDIYHSLEVGETWLSQAEEADRIIQIFGETGTHPSPEDIARLSKSSDSPPEGSVNLLRFLREWNRAHHPDL